FFFFFFFFFFKKKGIKHEHHLMCQDSINGNSSTFIGNYRTAGSRDGRAIDENLLNGNMSWTDGKAQTFKERYCQSAHEKMDDSFVNKWISEDMDMDDDDDNDNLSNINPTARLDTPLLLWLESPTTTSWSQLWGGVGAPITATASGPSARMAGVGTGAMGMAGNGSVGFGNDARVASVSGLALNPNTVSNQSVIGAIPNWTSNPVGGMSTSSLRQHAHGYKRSSSYVHSYHSDGDEENEKYSYSPPLLPIPSSIRDIPPIDTTGLVVETVADTMQDTPPVGPAFVPSFPSEEALAGVIGSHC
ncbi:hypothetical protein RFI_19665, partial [Reticulomyxa filosa]